MKRRDFLGSCTLLSGIAALARADAAGGNAQPIRRYTRSLLVDIHGAPIRQARARRGDELRLPVSVRVDAVLPAAACPSRCAPAAALRRERGDPYACARRRGAGAQRRRRSRRSARTSSPIRRATCRSSAISRSRSATSSGRVIHCCADHSVYDPMAGARVVAGPGAAAARRDRAGIRRGDVTSSSAHRHDRRRAVRAVLREVRVQARARIRRSRRARNSRSRRRPSCAN